MKLTLKVNGKTKAVEIPADKPLLWVLRDEFDLTGPKYGCGIARCGACTVLVDGVAARSCNRAAATFEGKSITTIEGLSPDGSHPLQKAWIDLDVPQCGYCQAGQIMSAASLLNRNPKPTDDEIDQAMNGNICRCATYVRIHDAIKKAVVKAATDASSPPPGRSTDAHELEGAR